MNLVQEHDTCCKNYSYRVRQSFPEPSGFQSNKNSVYMTMTIGLKSYDFDCLHLFYRKWFRFDNGKKLAWPRKMSTMDEMFPKCINVPVVFAGHNCWLFSRRDQFVLYIAVLHTVVKNRLSFSFSNAYLIKCLHLLGWNVLFLLGSFSSYSNIAKLAFSIQKKKIS